MGTWGTGAFDDDEASDWLDQAVANGLASAVAATLAERLAKKGRRGAAEKDVRVRAACEVVAIAHEVPPADLDSDTAALLAPGLETLRATPGVLDQARAAHRLVKAATLRNLSPKSGAKLPDFAEQKARLKANIREMRDQILAGETMGNDAEEAAAWRAWAEKPLEELYARVDAMGGQGNFSDKDRARWTAALSDLEDRLARAVAP
ncbi:MAG: DUF4259 domain-containing protein [Pikeienuella sp.]